MNHFVLNFSEGERDMLSSRIRNLSRKKSSTQQKKQKKSMTQQLYETYFRMMKDTMYSHFMPTTDEAICNILWEKTNFPNRDIDPVKIDREFSNKNFLQKIARDYSIIIDRNNQFIKDFFH